jgi:Replication protein C (RepC)
MPDQLDADKLKAKPKVKRTAWPKPLRLDFAKMDPSLFGTALFRPFRDGPDRLRTVEIKREYGGENITVISPYQLGAFDLSVLLAIISISGQKTRGLKLRPADVERHQSEIEPLQPKGEAITAEHLVVELTVYELLTAAGLTIGGENYEAVERSLKRLRGVYYVREAMEGNKRVRFSGAQEQLLFYRVTDDGDIRVTLSERLSRALLGTPFKSLHLPDYRLLKGDVTRILLTRLVCITTPGVRLPYQLNGLVELVYHEGIETMTIQQAKDRRRALRKALVELDKLPSWRVVGPDYRNHVVFTNLRRVSGILIEKDACDGIRDDRHVHEARRSRRTDRIA